MALNRDVRSSGVTRRHLVGGAAALAASLAMTRHGLAQESTPVSDADGEWSFTDDKGVTVTLPSRPERLVIDVNAAAPLWDFGIRPVAVFGWSATETGDFGDAGGNIDSSIVDIVGNVSEPIQPEAVVAANPDLIITLTYMVDEPTEYWSIDSEILPQVQQIAPIIAMSGRSPADDATERFAELAEALGADLSTPELSEARERYEAALEEFQAVAADKADLSTVFLTADTENIFVANTLERGDLDLFIRLGLNIVETEAEPGSYWEQLSLEQALKYPADVLFQSVREDLFTSDELAAHPTLGEHPAVQAGQIGDWNQDFIRSYQGLAETLESTMAALGDATDVTD